MTRPEAVTLALYLLGGEKDTLDTEDVAVKVEEVAPGMFSWQKHPERIDKELVRVALSDSRLKSGFVVGSHSKGWILTAKGLAFANRMARQLASTPVSKRLSKDDQQLIKERTRLLTSDAFQLVRNGLIKDVSPDQADAFFRLNIYVRGAARDKKIARIENAFSHDPDLGKATRILASIARQRS